MSNTFLQKQTNTRFLKTSNFSMLNRLVFNIHNLTFSYVTLLLFMIAFVFVGQSNLQGQDLSISQSVSNSSVAIGDNVTFTITVTNESLSDANGVVVTSSLPTGVSNVTTTGVHDTPNNLVTWNVGSVPASSSTSLDISMQINTDGISYNVAEIIAMTETDIDSTPGNGDVTEDDIFSACVSVPVRFCLGDALTASAPPGYPSYQWLRNGVPIAGATNQDYIIIQEGSYTFETTGFDCPAEVCCPFVAVYHPTPNADAGPDISSCADGNLTLSGLGTGGTAPYSYAWSGPDNFTSSLQNPTITNISNANNGTYSVTVTDANGCEAVDEVDVNLLEQPTASMSPASEICSGDDAVIFVGVAGGQSPYNYNWSNGLPNLASHTVSPASTVNYTVTVSDANGCTTTGSVAVTVNACTYDLAVTMGLAPGQTSDVSPGDDVEFLITVYNQGVVDANNIRLIDYVDPQFWEAFSTVDNPNGFTSGDLSLPYLWSTSGTDGETAITGTLPAGSLVTLPVTLTVGPDAVGQLDNYIEVLIDDGNDIDSQPESEENDGNGDTLINDVTNNAGGDEDDHDIESVNSSVFDLALSVAPAPGQATTINPGETVDFLITLINQGSEAATNITLNDYVDLTMWDPFNLGDNVTGSTGGALSLPYVWFQNGTDGQVTLIGSLPAGATITLPVSLTAASGFIGQLDNYVEIHEDNNNDIDSQPEADEGDRNGDPLVDDVVDDNGTTD